MNIGSYFSRKNPYRWVLIVALAVPLLLIGCGVISYLVTISQDPLPDYVWTTQIEMALDKLGIEVRDIQVADNRSTGGERNLTIKVGDLVNKQNTDPVMLVSGIQIVASAAFQKTPRPRSIDNINIQVYQQDGTTYSVGVSYAALEQAMGQKITESEFLAMWQIEGNAPKFVLPNQK